jgi:uncharacterized protein (TIGR00251 family)
MSGSGFDLASTAEGTLFRVRVSPGASRERVSGLHDGALKVSVAAAPEKGRANTALVKFLAKTMGVSRKDLSIASGETDRNKRLLLEGRDIEETEKLLKRAAGL